jgi:hypothetical protein
MRDVLLSSADWSVRAVRAETFLERLRGNRGAPIGVGVMLAARSVHSLGQGGPIELVGLDRSMRVVATRTLPPNRIAVMPSARVVVELPCGSPVPDLGEQVVVSDG